MKENTPSGSVKHIIFSLTRWGTTSSWRKNTPHRHNSYCKKEKRSSYLMYIQWWLRWMHVHTMPTLW